MATRAGAPSAARQAYHARGSREILFTPGRSKGQLQEDPWVQCPLPRLLPGLTQPLVRVWRDALPDRALRVVNSTDYLRQPAAFLSDLFTFLGVRALSPEEMRAIVALPTTEASKVINDDMPWREARNAPPFSNTSRFLAAWYQSHANRSGCWE